MARLLTCLLLHAEVVPTPTIMLMAVLLLVALLLRLLRCLASLPLSGRRHALLLLLLCVLRSPDLGLMRGLLLHQELLLLEERLLGLLRRHELRWVGRRYNRGANKCRAGVGRSRQRSSWERRHHGCWLGHPLDLTHESRALHLRRLPWNKPCRWAASFQR